MAKTEEELDELLERESALGSNPVIADVSGPKSSVRTTETPEPTDIHDVGQNTAAAREGEHPHPDPIDAAPRPRARRALWVRATVGGLAVGTLGIGVAVVATRGGDNGAAVATGETGDSLSDDPSKTTITVGITPDTIDSSPGSGEPQPTTPTTVEELPQPPNPDAVPLAEPVLASGTSDPEEAITALFAELERTVNGRQDFSIHLLTEAPEYVNAFQNLINETIKAEADKKYAMNWQYAVEVQRITPNPDGSFTVEYTLTPTNVLFRTLPDRDDSRLTKPYKTSIAVEQFVVYNPDGTESLVMGWRFIERDDSESVFADFFDDSIY